ncbi:MAG: substrate-binding domain-containing protein, partial [Chloroflexota bacterium]
THTKELSVWETAGITPEGDWYQEAGQGMGAVLTLADEQQAYTLSDRGTYIARTAEGTELIVMVEGDAALANSYGVIPVNPETHPDVNFEGATAFVEWLTSVEVQEAIAAYTVEGQQLFFPNSEAYQASQSE